MERTGELVKATIDTSLGRLETVGAMEIKECDVRIKATLLQLSPPHVSRVLLLEKDAPMAAS